MPHDDDCVISHASLTFSHVNFIAIQLALVFGATQVKMLVLKRQDLETTLIVMCIVIALFTGVFTFYLCIQTWIDSQKRRRIFGDIAYVGLIVLNLMIMIMTVITGFALV